MADMDVPLNELHVTIYMSSTIELWTNIYIIWPFPHYKFVSSSNAFILVLIFPTILLKNAINLTMVAMGTVVMFHDGFLMQPPPYELIPTVGRGIISK